MSSKQHIPPTVFDSIDDLTRDAILHLNKKLIELKKEITIKLELLGEDGDEKSKPQKKQLLVLDGEIERALRSIDKVVNMVVSEDLSSSEFVLKNHEELNKFREMMITNAEIIAKISEKK